MCVSRILLAILTLAGGAAFSWAATPTPVDIQPPTPTSARTLSATGTIIELSPKTDVDNSIQIQEALCKAKPGDTILLHAGTYRCSDILFLNPVPTNMPPRSIGALVPAVRSGTPAARSKLWDFGDGKVVLDFSGQAALYGSDSNKKKDFRGIVISKDLQYWWFRGLEIAHAGDNAIKCEGSDNVFLNCIFRENGDSGLQIGLNKDTYKSNPDPAKYAASNLVFNCDAFLNYDTQTKGSNSDGFACKLHAGDGNYFYGCRAWENGDDGWDLYMVNADVTIENCWAISNGKDSGNMNGFKLGSGNDKRGVITVVKCIAAHNGAKGIDQNNSKRPMKIYNCLSFDNGKAAKPNYNFKNPSAVSTNPIVLHNCINIPFLATTKDKSMQLDGVGDNKNNTWKEIDPTKKFANTIPVDLTWFLKTDFESAIAPRQPDGSLPNSGFGQLDAAKAAALIDKGVNTGFAYSVSGSTCDIGPYEQGLGPLNYTYGNRIINELK
jgi:pectate disaccharide-lyase